MGKPGRLKKKLSSYSREQRSHIPLLASGSQVLLILKGPVKELLFSLKDQVCDGEFFLSLEEIVTF